MAGHSKPPSAPVGIWLRVRDPERPGLRRVLRWVAAVCVVQPAFALSAHARPEYGQLPAGLDVRQETHEVDGRSIVFDVIDLADRGPRVVLRFPSFDTNASEGVRFIQESEKAQLLGRITNGVPTRFDGALLANGSVYLVNPAGILFGSTSVIDTASLIAAASDVNDAEFLRSGQADFVHAQGAVENAGRIEYGSTGINPKVDGLQSAIALLGATVKNSGEIVAPGGLVLMVAGRDVLLTRPDSNVAIRVAGVTTELENAVGPDAIGAQNSGSIDAGSGEVNFVVGDVYSLGVQQEDIGSTRAGRIQLESAGSGAIALQGGLAGTIDAATGTGGSIDIDTPNELQIGAISADGGSVSLRGAAIRDASAGDDTPNLSAGSASLQAVGAGGSTPIAGVIGGAGDADVDVALTGALDASAASALEIESAGRLRLGAVNAPSVTLRGATIEDGSTANENANVSAQTAVLGATGAPRFGTSPLVTPVIGGSGDRDLDLAVTERLDARTQPADDPELRGSIAIDSVGSLPVGSVRSASVTLSSRDGSLTDALDAEGPDGHNVEAATARLTAGAGGIGDAAHGDLDVRVRSRFDASAGTSIDLEATGDLNLGAVGTQGNARIVSSGSLLDAGDPDTSANLTAGSAQLTAAGSIGTSASDLDVAVNGPLDAQAGTGGTDEIHLDSSTSFQLGSVSAGGLVRLRTPGSIEDATGSDAGEAPNVRAGRADLGAGGSIGTDASDLDVSVQERLDAQAASDVYLEAASGLRLGVVRAGGLARLAARGGSLDDATESDTGEAANVIAARVDLSAARSIGTAAADLDLAVSGRVDARAGATANDEIHLDSPGSLQLGTISAGGLVQIHAEGSLEDATAADGGESANISGGRADLSASGSIGTAASDLDLAVAGRLDARAGSAPASDLHLEASAFRLGSVSAGGLVRLNARLGSIEDATDGDAAEAPNVSAGRSELNAAGSVGTTASDLDVAVSGRLDARSTTGNVVLESGDGLKLGAVSAGILARLTSRTGSIEDFSAADAGEVANVSASRAELRAPSGSIGTSLSDLDVVITGRLDATAGPDTSHEISLDSSSGLRLGSISSGGFVRLNTRSGSLEDATEADANEAANVSAERAELTAAGSIGSASSDLDVAVTGRLDALAGASSSSDVSLDSAGGLKLGTAAAGGLVRLSARGGSLEDASDADAGEAPNVSAGRTDLSAARSIGSASSDLNVAVTGRVDARAGSTASDDVHLDSSGGLKIGAVSAGGLVQLTARGGSLEDATDSDANESANVSAGRTQLVAANSIGTASADLDVAVVGRLDATAGNTPNGEVRLDTAGGLALGSVSAGGLVRLNARAGSIEDATADDDGEAPNLSAGRIDLSASRSIGTDAADLDVTVTGRVDARAGSEAGDDLHLDTSGGLVLGAGSACGLVRLDARGGSIEDATAADGGEAANIAADRTVLVASGSIGTTASDLDVELASRLDATAGAAGDVVVDSANGLKLGVVRAGGLARLSARGGSLEDATGLDLSESANVGADRAELSASGSIGTGASDLDVDVAGRLDATAGSGSSAEVHLEASSGLRLGAVSAGGLVELAARGDSIEDATEADVGESANVTARRANLNATGSIGTGASDLDVAVSGRLDARAGFAASDEIVLESPDALQLGAVFAGGRVRLEAATSIEDATSGDANEAPNVTAGTSELIAGHLLGSEDSDLDVAVTGRLDASVGDDSDDAIHLHSAQDLALGNVSAGGRVRLEANGSIVDATLSDVNESPNLIAGSAELFATGSVGTNDLDLQLAVANRTDASAGADVVLEGTTTPDVSDFRIGSIRAGGNVRLLASEGSLLDALDGSESEPDGANVSSQQVTLTAAQSIGTDADDLDVVAGTRVDATAGTSIDLDSPAALRLGVVRAGTRATLQATALSDADLTDEAGGDEGIANVVAPSADLTATQGDIGGPGAADLDLEASDELRLSAPRGSIYVSNRASTPVAVSALDVDSDGRLELRQREVPGLGVGLLRIDPDVSIGGDGSLHIESDGAVQLQGTVRTLSGELVLIARGTLDVAKSATSGSGPVDVTVLRGSQPEGRVHLGADSAELGASGTGTLRVQADRLEADGDLTLTGSLIVLLPNEKLGAPGDPDPGMLVHTAGNLRVNPANDTTSLPSESSPAVVTFLAGRTPLSQLPSSQLPDPSVQGLRLVSEKNIVFGAGERVVVTGNLDLQWNGSAKLPDLLAVGDLRLTGGGNGDVVTLLNGIATAGFRLQTTEGERSLNLAANSITLSSAALEFVVQGAGRPQVGATSGQTVSPEFTALLPVKRFDASALRNFTRATEPGIEDGGDSPSDLNISAELGAEVTTLSEQLTSPVPLPNVAQSRPLIADEVISYLECGGKDGDERAECLLAPVADAPPDPRMKTASALSLNDAYQNLFGSQQAGVIRAALQEAVDAYRRRTGRDEVTGAELQAYLEVDTGLAAVGYLERVADVFERLLLVQMMEDDRSRTARFMLQKIVPRGMTVEELDRAVGVALGTARGKRATDAAPLGARGTYRGGRLSWIGAQAE